MMRAGGVAGCAGLLIGCVKLSTRDDVSGLGLVVDFGGGAAEESLLAQTIWRREGM
jgi:hypothetical protein